MGDAKNPSRSRGSVDLYVDEHIMADRNTHPQIAVYSCQFDAFRAGDVENSKEKIFKFKKSPSDFQSCMETVAEGFVYHVTSNWSAPMTHLCKALTDRLMETDQILGNHGYGINKIYACNNIGYYLSRHISYRPDGWESKVKLMGRKIVTVCSSKKNDKDWGVHYNVKELVGQMARRRCTDVVDGLMDVAGNSMTPGVKGDKRERKQFFLKLAEDENLMGAYKFLWVDIPILVKDPEMQKIFVKN